MNLGKKATDTSAILRGATVPAQKRGYKLPDLSKHQSGLESDRSRIVPVELDKKSCWANISSHRKGKSDYVADTELNKKIFLWNGDITRLTVDAVVNAANNSLLGGGGVDGAIHRGAGNRLRSYNRKHHPKGCATGEAEVSPGFHLPAKYVISTVGPIGDGDESCRLLRSCYDNCLDIVGHADEIRSIAFPGISTGVYGFPVDKGAQVTLKAVREWFNEGNADKVDQVIFCTFLQESQKAFLNLLPTYFPKEDDSRPAQNDGSTKTAAKQVEKKSKRDADHPRASKSSKRPQLGAADTKPSDSQASRDAAVTVPSDSQASGDAVTVPLDSKANADAAVTVPSDSEANAGAADMTHKYSHSMQSASQLEYITHSPTLSSTPSPSTPSPSTPSPSTPSPSTPSPSTPSPFPSLDDK